MDAFISILFGNFSLSMYFTNMILRVVYFIIDDIVFVFRC